MDTLILPDANVLYVVIGGRTATGRLLDLAARLALRGPLLLLDCGNRANPLPLARELRRLTPDPVRALGNIQMARAFTCYQVTALLEDAARRPTQGPVILCDLLATFYDESVSDPEGTRLLDSALRCIAQIHRQAAVVVSARPPLAGFAERRIFLERVCQQADVLWTEEPSQGPAPQQYSLYDL